jgi:hypothetical protein
MNTENSELNFLRRIQLAKCVSAKDIQDPDELRTCITSAEEDLAQTMSALGFQYVATAITPRFTSDQLDECQKTPDSTESGLKPAEQTKSTTELSGQEHSVI